MHPSLLMLRIHFRPDVVLRVPHPTDPTSQSATQHGEAVGPLAHTAPSRLQQLPDIRIPWKAFNGAAGRLRTSIQLDSRGAAGGLIGRRVGHAVGNGGHETSRAGRVVHEREERPFEPPEEGLGCKHTREISRDSLEERSNDTILVSPLWLLSYTGRLCLEQLTFLFRLSV